MEKTTRLDERRSDRKKVAVFGGGIAGLTAAHELVKRGFEVSLFEQNDTCGGKASSYASDHHREGEHGFRFFPGFYRNVIETMADIPIEPDEATPRPARREANRFERAVNGLGRLTPLLAALGAIGVWLLVSGPFRWIFPALVIGVWYVAGRASGDEDAPGRGSGPSVREALAELQEAQFAATPRRGGQLTSLGTAVKHLMTLLRLVLAVAAVAALFQFDSWVRLAWVLALVVLWLVAGLAVRALQTVGTEASDHSLTIPLPSSRGPIAEYFDRTPLVRARWIISLELAVVAVVAAARGAGALWVVPAIVAVVVLLSPGTTRSVVYLWRRARSIPVAVLPGIFETIFAFLATVQVVTSCRSRLFRSFENQSWWGYIRAWRFSEEYRLAFATGLTRTFVATRAEQMSARTGGMILAQLMYDISPFFTRHHAADRILNGPTQEVWIDRWTDHLAQQGVRFNPPIAPGEDDGSPVRLVGLLNDTAAHTNGDPDRPVIAGFTYLREARGPRPLGQGHQPTNPLASQGDFDYYVLAVSATGAQDIMANSDEVVAVEHEVAQRTVPRGTDLPLRRTDDRWELADAGSPATIAGMFRLEFGWMNGIVYHLPRVVDLPKGHILCLDSEWALTALDQAPVWERVEGGPPTVCEEPIEGRSVLSVNVSDWFSPTRNRGLPARYHTLDDVRTEVWKQLQAHIPELGDIDCPPPERVVVDRAITDPNGEDGAPPPTGLMAHGVQRIHSERRPLINAERLLINTERSWDDRPAAATSFTNLVLAGDYVRTSTDFASMEAANESARRAVRQVLRQENRDESQYPEVHRLGEPPELRSLVTLFRWFDALLMSIGLPHPLSLLLGVFSWAAGIENLLRDRLKRLVGRYFVNRSQNHSAQPPSEAPPSPMQSIAS